MQKLIKTLLKVKFIIIAITITIVIAILSLIRLGKQPISFTNIDKVEHSIAYFTLTFSWLFALKSNKKNQRIILAVICILFGIVIEVLQSTITNYRTTEYLDIIANSFGVLLALLSFNFFVKRKKNVIN